MFHTCSTVIRINNCLAKIAAAYLSLAEELMNYHQQLKLQSHPAAFPKSLTSSFCLCRRVADGSPTGIYRPVGTQRLRAGIALILFLLFLDTGKRNICNYLFLTLIQISVSSLVKTLSQLDLRKGKESSVVLFRASTLWQLLPHHPPPQTLLAPGPLITAFLGTSSLEAMMLLLPWLQQPVYRGDNTTPTLCPLDSSQYH